MDGDLSPDEQRRLLLARLAIYAAPAAAGLLTASVASVTRSAGVAADHREMIAVYLGHTFAAGVVSAVAVFRLHPVYRGRLWRATAAFLYAIPMTYVFCGVFFSVGRGLRAWWT